MEEGPAKQGFAYEPGRIQGESKVFFNISRRVPNERCYSCHTSLDTGMPASEGLKQRWKHDGDIHLVKGMLCVDCHRHGLDHAVTRGYEGEAEARKDSSIKTLTCAGCHYGAAGPEGADDSGKISEATFTGT